MSFKNLLIIAFSIFLLSGCTNIHPDFFNKIELDKSKNVQSSVTAMASNDKRKLIALGYESGKVDVFEGYNGTKYMSFTPTAFNIGTTILNFSHNGKYLTVGANNDDGTYIYDMDSKSFVIQLNETRYDEIFTNDNKFLFLANHDIKIYDLEHKKWFLDYENGNHGFISSLTFNDDDTMLAIGRFGGEIELYSIQYTPWYKRLFSDKEIVSFSFISKIKIPHNEQCKVDKIWFVGDQLITLTQFTEFPKNSSSKSMEKMDIWSIPDIKNIVSYNLVSAAITKAILSDNKKYIIALGINNERKEGRYFVEQIDIEHKTSTIRANLRTNFPNIAKWPDTSKEKELIFIEHARSKMLLRIGEAIK